MKFISRQMVVATCVAAALLSACGGDDESTVPAPTGSQPSTTVTVPPVGTASTGTIDGQVLNASTGQGIAGAVVTGAGASATTGADGRYQLTNVAPSARTVVTIRATNFAEGMSVVTVAAAASSPLSTKLLPLGTTATVSNVTGGEVAIPNSAARVTLPAGAFGAAPGSVTVELTAVNPTLDASAMPGDYTTNNGERIESFGALIITPRDSAGTALNLAAGKTATLRIPAASRGALEPTIPLFFLDPATGSWVREGTATLQGLAPNQYYEGTVTHFSVWNADKVQESIQVSGCVQDAAGARVSGVNVSSDGINYSGVTSATTNASGSFTVAVKKSALATVGGTKGSQLTNTVRTEPSANNITLAQCLVLTSAVNAITIKLTWGNLPEDVDSHLYTPSGEHIYFGNGGSLANAPFANLDVDDLVAFGPEVITINRLMVGTYLYGVDNYSQSRSPALTASPIRVELNIGGQVRVFNAPAGETAGTNFVRLFTLTVDSRCAVTVTPVNTWEALPPDSVSSAQAPVYCTAP